MLTRQERTTSERRSFMRGKSAHARTRRGACQGVSRVAGRHCLTLRRKLATSGVVPRPPCKFLLPNAVHPPRWTLPSVQTVRRHLFRDILSTPRRPVAGSARRSGWRVAAWRGVASRLRGIHRRRRRNAPRGRAVAGFSWAAAGWVFRLLPTVAKNNLIKNEKTVCHSTQLN